MAAPLGRHSRLRIISKKGLNAPPYFGLIGGQFYFPRCRPPQTSSISTSQPCTEVEMQAHAQAVPRPAPDNGPSSIFNHRGRQAIQTVFGSACARRTPFSPALRPSRWPCWRVRQGRPHSPSPVSRLGSSDVCSKVTWEEKCSKRVCGVGSFGADLGEIPHLHLGSI